MVSSTRISYAPHPWTQLHPPTSSPYLSSKKEPRGVDQVPTWATSSAQWPERYARPSKLRSCRYLI
eukprot:138648-Ditylum_brightwellii.AAC.1